jgi:hypothetical protein
VAKLTAARDAWAKEMLPLVGDDQRPYTIGYGELTLLPARDGVPHGDIRRSAKPPNCSFFTNWRTTKDSMTWDIEIGNPGMYEAVVYYTCPAADAGSVIELSLGDARAEKKISEAHDPSLTGEKEDRAPRTESFVKDFRPLRIGTLKLPKARGLLTLRALSIAGSQVADVRYVALTRLRG